MTYSVSALPVCLYLGKAGENKFTTISIDISDWVDTESEDEVTYAVVIRRADGVEYPILATQDENIIEWTPEESDLVAGFGKFEIRMYNDDTIAKSKMISTYVSDSIELGTSTVSKTPDWAKSIVTATDVISAFPEITASDEGKVLGVVNGALAWVSLTSNSTNSGTSSDSDASDSDSSDSSSTPTDEDDSTDTTV